MTALRLFDPDDSQFPDAYTLKAIIILYLRFLESRVTIGDYSADAFGDAKRDLTRFADFRGSKLAEKFRPEFGKAQQPLHLAEEDVAEFLAANPQWESPSTRKRIVTLIKAALKWAEKREFITRSPLVNYRPRFAELPRREADPLEYIALMRWGSRPLRRALFFVRRAGVRPLEMRTLRWPEIHWEDSVVVQEHGKTFKATGIPRKFGLDKPLLRFLRNLSRSRPEGTEYVFLNSDGTPWDRHTFARHLRRYAKKIGLDAGVEKRVCAYCFRHTYISDAVEAGINDRAIADQVGHADTRMITWYSKARGKARHLRNVSNEISRRRRKKGDGPTA
jgi:integrase